ncbi:MAG: hypothetical protein HUJ27_11515 [Rhodobacteraceae bacterium]|nr:hypothetical protein [Paracoccaceae bacterium]
MWAEWFSTHRMTLSASNSQMILEDRHFQLSSTINGLGVSLFASWTVRNELERGDLVDPFQRETDTSFAYYVIVPRNIDLSTPAKRFRDWLVGISERTG